MNRVGSSIAIVSIGAVMFAIMYQLALPFPILFLMLLVAQGGLVWMVITILKQGKPSRHTFDKKWYDDQ